MTALNAFTAARFSAQTCSAYLQILETIDIIGNMFHVKHPSQFDRQISIQMCKQSQLSRTLLIKLKHSNSIGIRGHVFHVKHMLIRQKYIQQMYRQLRELHGTVKIAVITRCFA